MSFLTSQAIKKLNDSNRVSTPPQPDLVEPFDATRIAQASYELSLGQESFISEKNPEIRTLGPGSMLKIPAGQMAFLTTKEKVNIPKDCLAFISIKASKKLKGLINISGFHVDPGYSGHLLFSVFNSSPTDVSLKEGDALFLIWFYKLDTEDQTPYPANKGGKTINTDLVDKITDAFPSNGEISRELLSLKNKIQLIGWGMVAIGLPVGLIFFQLVLDTWKGRDERSTNTIIRTEKEIVMTKCDKLPEGKTEISTKK